MERKKYSKRYCRYTEAKIEFIDYKDVEMLKHSLSERYKIMPRRLTGNTKRWQERVEVAIKRARHMALIPYIVDRKSVVENPFKIYPPPPFFCGGFSPRSSFSYFFDLFRFSFSFTFSCLRCPPPFFSLSLLFVYFLFLDWRAFMRGVSPVSHPAYFSTPNACFSLLLFWLF